ncbi:hypothetical protein [Flavobacterium sp. H122]|uniref:hypothetical protein n=1 Tax=Flavobacterium sp. H122 TaxID=2529860 RepID=UPI0010AB3826|nr:hypothetical protein [Flavobacterium sp. H122]
MKFLNYILLVILFSSCSNGQDLKLEILSKEINSLDIKAEKYSDFMNEDSLISKRFKKAKTIITYKLTNNSNKTYFFNIKSFQKELINQNSIKLDKSYINIFDDKNEIVKINKSIPSRFLNEEELRFELLDYDFRYYSKGQNFIIHPKETLYFEWFVVLPFGCMIEEPKSIVELNSNKKYEIELCMTSYNNSKSQKYLSRTELETIKANGYEIFDGTIKSKNKIPIKFVK